MQFHLISKPSCQMCDEAKTLLTTKGHTYTEECLDTEAKREAYRVSNPTVRALPQVYQDGVRIGGYAALLKVVA